MPVRTRGAFREGPVGRTAPGGGARPRARHGRAASLQVPLAGGNAAAPGAAGRATGGARRGRAAANGAAAGERRAPGSASDRGLCRRSLTSLLTRPPWRIPRSGPRRPPGTRGAACASGRDGPGEDRSRGVSIGACRGGVEGIRRAGRRFTTTTHRAERPARRYRRASRATRTRVRSPSVSAHAVHAVLVPCAATAALRTPLPR